MRRPVAPVAEAMRFFMALAFPPQIAYPRLALRREQQGIVMLRVKVLADGTAAEVKIHKSSGHALLDEAAVESIGKTRFLPAKTKTGKPVDSSVLTPVKFQLEP